MAFFERRPALRWLVPLLAALLLTAGVSGVTALSASAGDKLEPRTASQLLVDVQKAQVKSLSGTIVQNADLGLPSLPGMGGTGSSDMTSLLSGSHTLRVWYAGPEKVRVALLGSLGESDVVRNGADLWTWSSKDKAATHRTLAAHSEKSPDVSSVSPLTPQAAADQALAAIDPSTKVSTSGTSTVAGRPAYELLLQPRDSSSLVESVRIAVDGETQVPTRVQVFAKNLTKPALEVAFTSFDPTAPSDSVFSFNPPPGTEVTESSTANGDASRSGSDTGATASPAKPSTSKPQITGSGWASVLVTKVPDMTAGTGGQKSGSAGSLAQVLRSLPTVKGAWGSGHLLQGTLFSAVLTDDGRLAVGAVSPDVLYAALGR